MIPFVAGVLSGMTIQKIFDGGKEEPLFEPVEMREVLMNMINELIEEFRPTMTLEDLQRVYTKTVDEVIFKEEDKSNSRYVGGEFNLDYVSEKSYTVGYRLFFRNEQKKIFELEAKSRELSISKLSEKVREQLKAEKNIKFEIPEPSKSSRERHDRQSFNRAQ